MKTVKTFEEFLIECEKTKKTSAKAKEEHEEEDEKKEESFKVDDNFDEVLEKWDKDVEIKKTGEHAGKTVAELRKQMANLKGKKPFDREKYSELMFALRAKQGWKKGEGATKK